MFKKSQLDIITEESLKTQRPFLEKQLEANFDRHEKLLSVFIKALEFAKEKDLEQVNLIWNVGAFISICSYDLKVAGKELILATNEWQKRYFARQVSLLIYESINDIQDLYGKEFRKAISTLSNSEELLTDLKQISAALNLYRENHITLLKKIRNVATAHRDKDIMQQFNVIKSISWPDTINYMTEFDDILNQSGAFLMKAVKSVNDDRENKQ